MPDFIMEGHKEVIAALRNADHVVDREGKRFLRDMAIYGVKQATIHTLNAGSVDLGELIGGIHHTLKKESGDLTATIRPSDKADKYAIYVEEGTRPHFPPIAALQGWADRHGIPVWAVALKIAREGTEPRYMWRDTFSDLLAKVDSEIREFANELVRKI